MKPQLFLNGIELRAKYVVLELGCNDAGKEHVKALWGKPVTMTEDLTFVDDVLGPKPWPNDDERLRNGWPKCVDLSVLTEPYGSPRISWLDTRALRGFTLDKKTLREWKGRRR